MKTLGLGRYAVCIVAATASLIACGGSQPPVSAPGAMPQAPRAAARADRGTSWMLPEAKGEDLLYISEEGEVKVFSYPAAKLVGTLEGSAQAFGLCSDKAGNVWIGMTGAVVEYAHGGMQPIKTLEEKVTDGGAFVSSCSVDATTGDLSTVNYSEDMGPSSPGNIAIYENASGLPKTYCCRLYPVSAGYDASGNLFATGYIGGEFKTAALYELSFGTKTLHKLRLHEAIDEPSGLQWDGRYVAIGDNKSGVVDQFEIHGKGAFLVGATTLTGGYDVMQFWIQGQRIIGGPNRLYTQAMFWKYPTGGAPVKTIKAASAFGVTVSEARK